MIAATRVASFRDSLQAHPCVRSVADVLGNCSCVALPPASLQSCRLKVPEGSNPHPGLVRQDRKESVILDLVAPRIHALQRHKVHPCTESGIHFWYKSKWAPGRARGDCLLIRGDCLLIRGDCLLNSDLYAQAAVEYPDLHRGNSGITPLHPVRRLLTVRSDGSDHRSHGSCRHCS